jgi:hypothetical protein
VLVRVLHHDDTAHRVQRQRRQRGAHALARRRAVAARAQRCGAHAAQAAQRRGDGAARHAPRRGSEAGASCALSSASSGGGASHASPSVMAAPRERERQLRSELAWSCEAPPRLACPLRTA